MKQHPSDDEFRRAYEPFGREHERLRGELLEALPERVPTLGASARWSLRFSLRRTGLKVAALAACVAVVVTTWILFFENRTTQAYTIDTVRQQMMQVKSFHVKGWMYVQSETADGGEITERYPLEWFMERPDRSWNRTCGFSFSGRVLTKVSEGTSARDGNRLMYVDHDRKVATTFKIEPQDLDGELAVERDLDHLLTDLLIQGSLASYRQVAVETMNGLRTLRYERVWKPKGVEEGRNVVWLNPRTGLPVRCENYTRDAAGGERLGSLYDEIRVNVPAPPHMFTFQPPEGYRLEEGVNRRRSADDPLITSVAAGGGRALRLGDLYSFMIDDRAILVCWAFEDTVRGSPTEDEWQKGKNLPSLTLTSSTGTRSCIHRLLRSDERKSHTWRWSLVVPSDFKAIDDDQLYITAKAPNLQATSIAQPLRLDRKRLADVIVRAQKFTLPSGSPIDKILTLDQIKAEIDSMEKDRPKEP
jgi:outer membrane lipoprotein-sorting protein